MEDKHKIPIGRDFLIAIREQEDQSETIFEEWFAAEVELDSADLFGKLGTALSYLDRVPRCSMGCGDSSGLGHLEKHLVAMVTSNARASIRLLMAGYLTEAATITRSMGETVNLMFLFMNSEDYLETYRKASMSARQKHFSPGKVRKKLENLGTGSLMDQEPYRMFSQFFVHTTAALSPLSNSVSGAPAEKQLHEVVAALRSLMMVAGWVNTTLMFADRLVEQHEDKLDILHAAIELHKVLDAYQSVVQEFDPYMSLN